MKKNLKNSFHSFFYYTICFQLSFSGHGHSKTVPPRDTAKPYFTIEEGEVVVIYPDGDKYTLKKEIIDVDTSKGVCIFKCMAQGVQKIAMIRNAEEKQFQEVWRAFFTDDAECYMCDVTNRQKKEEETYAIRALIPQRFSYIYPDHQGDDHPQTFFTTAIKVCHDEFFNRAFTPNQDLLKWIQEVINLTRIFSLSYRVVKKLNDNGQAFEVHEFCFFFREFQILSVIIASPDAVPSEEGIRILIVAPTVFSSKNHFIRLMLMEVRVGKYLQPFMYVVCTLFKDMTGLPVRYWQDVLYEALSIKESSHYGIPNDGVSNSMLDLLRSIITEITGSVSSKAPSNIKHCEFNTRGVRRHFVGGAAVTGPLGPEYLQLPQEVDIGSLFGDIDSLCGD